MVNDQHLSQRDKRATVAVAVQFAVNGAFFASILPRLPELRDKLDISTTAIGVLMTVASVSGLASSATCKRVIGRFGTQRVLLVGGALISIALMFVGLSSAWPLTMLALAAMFAFDVYVDVAMNMQGSWLSARRTRPIMSRLHGLWSLGSVLGGLISARLASKHVSLQTHLMVAGIVLIITSTAIASQLLDKDEVHEDAPSAVVEATEASSARTMFFVAGLTAVMIEIASINWAAFRLSDDLHASKSTSALAYAAVLGGMTVTRFFGDHLSHRIGPQRFIVGSAVLAVLGLLASSVIGAKPLTIAAFAVAGLGIATLMPRLYDLAARAGGGTASGLGVLTAGMRLATILTPITIAAIASRTSVGAAIAIFAVAAGVPFILTIRKSPA